MRNLSTIASAVPLEMTASEFSRVGFRKLQSLRYRMVSFTWYCV